MASYKCTLHNKPTNRVNEFTVQKIKQNILNDK